MVGEGLLGADATIAMLVLCVLKWEELRVALWM